MPQLDISKMEKLSKKTPKAQNFVSATYSVFSNDDDWFFQIDTYGSDNRKTPGKCSQTIQLNKENASKLIDLMSKELKTSLPETDNQHDPDNEYSKKDFLNEAYLTPEQYESLTQMLFNKKNIILQGAPGVGKTFIAKRLAKSILGLKDSDKIKTIQFHQSYSYEDFIVGYRPNEEGFKIEYGPFYEFCKKAEKEPGAHFFIIDEINRGNISKIFGELLMLIEKDKRNESLDLLYTKEPFSVPDNVYIIGMMNTADRSLAHMDYALRRRFSFYNLKPGFDTPGFKKEMNESLDPDRVNKLISVVKELNKAIEEDESLGAGFQIGHSYFSSVPKEAGGKDQDEVMDQWMKMVVENDLIPLIEEYWFDNPDEVSQWSQKLREAIKRLAEV